MSDLIIQFKTGEIVQVDNFSEYCNNRESHTMYQDLKYLSLKPQSTYTFIGESSVTVKGEDVLYIELSK